MNNDDTSVASSVKMNSWGFHEKAKKKVESDLCLDSYQKPNIKDLEMENWNELNQ